jgi:hypothetical protein
MTTPSPTTNKHPSQKTSEPITLELVPIDENTDISISRERFNVPKYNTTKEDGDANQEYAPSGPL